MDTKIKHLFLDELSHISGGCACICKEIKTGRTKTIGDMNYQSCDSECESYRVHDTWRMYVCVEEPEGCCSFL